MFRAMDLPQYLQGLSFRFAQPERQRSTAGQAATAVLTRLGVPLDAFNARLPFDRSDVRRRLRRTRVGSGALPLAIRAILNRGVAHLADGEAFVAFGMKDGESLLAAVAGNAQKFCVGIQETERTEVGAAFRKRFEELSAQSRHFVEESLRTGVKRLDNRPIGLCFVSADSHEPIARQLTECEPHFAENAYLLVDNANCERTRQAALQFVADSRNQYRVLMDARTPKACELTWGHGLLVMQLLGRNAAGRALSSSPVLVPAA
jgi:hypothetical protein